MTSINSCQNFTRASPLIACSTFRRSLLKRREIIVIAQSYRFLYNFSTDGNPINPSLFGQPTFKLLHLVGGETRPRPIGAFVSKQRAINEMIRRHKMDLDRLKLRPSINRRGETFREIVPKDCEHLRNRWIVSKMGNICYVAEDGARLDIDTGSGVMHLSGRNLNDVIDTHVEDYQEPDANVVYEDFDKQEYQKASNRVQEVD
ncbi:hypothetical protein G9A89_015270 [Geosiphon pyriformis]|nr:hypothetical protein G9A89_015270 [Geosiphon pyriformis]